MHLKRLTMKGFKSFAQATTFALEPGITCVVGPNGSGKSNVVDALAWVMGEQGAKTLRGGTMSDVIFAGTTTKSPLGRAEVTLTIDNADGALAIEYAEVTISRTLFRSGSSEYAINGTSCRLLDVQELLSDAGLGREMHVIVGQGQLDAVLRATPEERRGFIEEAAGILKHRRRKERTERKLESMQANLIRLSDLAGEVRRQLKPLGAQAQVAREAASIQAEVRAARAALAAHDLLELRRSLDAMRDEQQSIDDERQIADDAVRALARRAAALEAAEPTAELDVARRSVLELEGVRERMRGLAQLAASRLALLGGEDAEPTAPADTATGDRDEAIAAIAALEAQIAAAESAHAAAREAARRRQADLDLIDRGIAERSAQVAAYDLRLTELGGRLRSAEARLVSATADAERRAGALAAAQDRAQAAAAALAEPASAVAAAAADDPDSRGLPDLTTVETAIAVADDAVSRARADVHRLEREHDALAARAAALELAADRPSATAELVAAGASGVTRRVSDAITVRDGWHTAIAAALGELADAALADSHAAALATLDRAGDLGALDVVVADATPRAATGATHPHLVGAATVVDASAGVLALLRRVLLAPDRVTALAAWPSIVGMDADAVIVTRDGETIGAAVVRAPGTGRSRLELTVERDDAVRRGAQTAVDLDESRARLHAEQSTLAVHRADLAEAQRRAQALDAAVRSAERERAGLIARADAAAAEQERLARQVADAHAVAQAAAATRAAALQALDVAHAEPRPQLEPEARIPALAAVDAARDAALRAQLALETLRERHRAERARLVALAQRIDAAQRAAEAAARRAALRRLHRDAALGVLDELPDLQASVDRSVAEAQAQLGALEQRRREQSGALSTARREEAQERARLGTLIDRGRALDMRLYEQQLSLGTLTDRAAADLGLTPDELVRDHANADAQVEFDRNAMEQRLAAAERTLARLGRVNPLALEEFAALEQRHAFLTDQLADLERTRADLGRIIGDLDSRMQTIFEEAFGEVRDAFARIFPVLFPGGTGSLSLTEPDDLNASGIEVAVRPAGKKIERMSLLSGGERSLAATAFLIAIFTARPSPFYILDEVEAALDDANLGRLLQVVESLRDASQLILITHQKRTMEIADVLYGVSMGDDGVSAVVGQRLVVRA